MFPSYVRQICIPVHTKSLTSPTPTPGCGCLEGALATTSSQIMLKPGVNGPFTNYVSCTASTLKDDFYWLDPTRTKDLVWVTFDATNAMYITYTGLEVQTCVRLYDKGAIICTTPNHAYMQFITAVPISVGENYVFVKLVEPYVDVVNGVYEFFVDNLGTAYFSAEVMFTDVGSDVYVAKISAKDEKDANCYMLACPCKEGVEMVSIAPVKLAASNAVAVRSCGSVFEAGEYDITHGEETFQANVIVSGDGPVKTATFLSMTTSNINACFEFRPPALVAV